MNWTEIHNPDELTALFGTPTFRAANKVRARLHPLDVDWLAASPFCLVGTSDETGRCDVPPQATRPDGSCTSSTTPPSRWPNAPGNKRVDGYRNILRNPFVGLNFFVPGRGDTLRINGRARLVTEAPFFDELRVADHRPILCLVVEIEEIFHHCAKAFMRSKLWDPDTWNPTALPSVAALAKATVPDAPETLEELERYYGPSYAQQLYRPQQPR